MARGFRMGVGGGSASASEIKEHGYGTPQSGKGTSVYSQKSYTITESGKYAVVVTSASATQNEYYTSNWVTSLQKNGTTIATSTEQITSTYSGDVGNGNGMHSKSLTQIVDCVAGDILNAYSSFGTQISYYPVSTVVHLSVIKI